MDQGRQVFTVDLLERYAAKGRGVITCMTAGNDVIVIGTSRGWVIRHDFGVGDSHGKVSIDIDTSYLVTFAFWVSKLVILFVNEDRGCQ